MQFSPYSCSFWIPVSHFSYPSSFFPFLSLLASYQSRGMKYMASWSPCHFWAAQNIHDLFSLSQSPNCLIIFFSISILHIFSSCFFMLLLPLWMKLKLLFPAVSFLICSSCFLPVILTSFFFLSAFAPITLHLGQIACLYKSMSLLSRGKHYILMG